MALPYLFHQNSRYGRFAYDDFSEYDSDREVESAQQQQIVSLFTLFMGEFPAFCLWSMFCVGGVGVIKKNGVKARRCECFELCLFYVISFEMFC